MPETTESPKTIDWQKSEAAVWRTNQQQLRAIKHLDRITLEQLIGIDRQKQALIDNPSWLVNGLPCHNARLWGASGTGNRP